MPKSKKKKSFQGYQVTTSGLRFTNDFLLLFCEKNSDGTKKLRLKGNELQQRFNERLLPADMVHICEFLKHHPEINEIDVSYNAIEDEALEILSHVTLNYQNNLQHLNMSNCDITHLGIRTLYHISLEGFVQLKTLRLTGNKIGPQGGHLIALTIPSIPALEYLDLGDTDQTLESLEYIFQSVIPSTLKVLNMSRAMPPSSLNVVNDTFLAESLSELCRMNKDLVELHAQKCNLDAHDIELLAFGLKHNKSLKFLDVGYNNLCCIGVEFLCKWLETRPELLGLNLAGNKVKDYGAAALSFSMPFSKLRYLDLSYNHISDKGLIPILHSIKKPYMLRYFFIWGNSFTHPTNKIIKRMMLSKVFDQEGIDVKIYEVDGVLHAARYTVDRYKHRYYGVTDYACATELKIKKNRVEEATDQPRALVNFKHIDRFPEICTCKPCPSYAVREIILHCEERGEE